MKRKPIGDIAKDEARAESRRCGGCPTDKERQILDMWPRYEDTGDCVMPGDRVARKKMDAAFGGIGGEDGEA